MKKLLTLSHLGGLEIIQKFDQDLLIKISSTITNSETYLSGSLEKQFNILKSFYNFEKFAIESVAALKGISLSPRNPFPLFIHQKIGLYFPRNQKDDFWFDLLLLEFLHSNHHFESLIILLDLQFGMKFPMDYPHLLSLVKDRILGIPNFPMFIVCETEI